MITKKRIGSVVPCENVDPHTGSFLDYGVIIEWQDAGGNKTTRAKAEYALIERTGRKVSNWSDWAQEHAWLLKSY